MSRIQSMILTYQFNRDRTIATLDRIVDLDSSDALGWRPGPGRAHVAWQLMHIGITEDIFAAERLPEPSLPGNFAESWERYRGGSTPDDTIPTVEEIKEVLNVSRESLLKTLSGFNDNDLDSIPSALQERGWTIGTVLNVLSWHEAHHQGQAHLTLNLFENR